ncbi:MAG: hypothetical protein JWN86_4634 [Planctomycetota bacterium]|nr:hypothetical protein [Planctomycetota bacterium]
MGSETVETLEKALRSVDPRVRLVSSRTLRRVIKYEQESTVLGLHHAHHTSLTVSASVALQAVGPDELGLDPASPLPDLLLLIEYPELEGNEDWASLLLWGWRRLFHASVHAVFATKFESGMLDSAAVSAKIGRIDRVTFQEIRGVLDQEGWLLNPEDEVATYEEFAAVYLEFRHFSRILLGAYFPGIEDFSAIDAILSEDIEGDALFQTTRPDGAPDPPPPRAFEDKPPPAPDLSPDDVAPPKSEARYRLLLKLADRARRMGNVVRSAILRTRAATLVGPARAGQARGGAEDDLDRLASRIVKALGLEESALPRWRPALSALLQLTRRGTWTAEARILYDLQSLCVEQEREVFEVNLVGWLISFGKRPLKRPLPNLKLIRISTHLRRALARLPRSRIGEPERSILTAFLVSASDAAEETTRERFRPLIGRALERADFRPANLPERVSFERMTEELLDEVVDRSYLSMGDVRDAISRSDLRQPDLAGPLDLWRGDRVLKANRKFAVSLEGVYHRGEIYLRLLQRFSQLAFGTRIGRWLTLYVVLPYGGAFGALVTVEELLGLLHFHRDFKHYQNVLALGTLILFAIHSARFRDLLSLLLHRAWRILRAVLIDTPAWLLKRPAVRALLASPAFDLIQRLVLRPLPFAAAAFATVFILNHDRRIAAGFAATSYAVLSLFLGTRIGRLTEEIVWDAGIKAWKRLSVDFLPGLLRFILDLFDAILETVERILYMVDEKLRFRSGQGRVIFWIKAVFGVIWKIITYVIRIFINLMVEPTINPVKHFPTVTVAAKMILPEWLHIANAISRPFAFLGPVPSTAIGWTLVVFLPGLAGFFVWELKENWRLFEANRPMFLRPTMIGHHGETMRRLVLPGFHSGTIPKLFTKLRRGVRFACLKGDPRLERKAREGLHHVEIPIQHFINRGLLAFLIDCHRFAEGEIRVCEVKLATNRVKVILDTAGQGGDRVAISFENDNGFLIGKVMETEWVRRLSEDRRRTLDASLAGSMVRAGVDRVVGLSATGTQLIHGSMGSINPELSRSTPRPRIAWMDWVDFWARECPLAPEFSSEPQPVSAT